MKTNEFIKKFFSEYATITIIDEDMYLVFQGHVFSIPEDRIKDTVVTDLRLGERYGYITLYIKSMEDVL